MFNYHLLLVALHALQSDDALHHVMTPPFLMTCKEIMRFTRLLGPALYFAVEHLHTTLAHLTTCAKQTSALRVLVDRETSSSARATSTPTTATYSFIRLVWMLSLTEALITNLLFTHPHATIAECACAAYEQRLAGKHTWALRLAVRASLHACPTKSQLFEEVEKNHLGADAFDVLCTLHSLLQKPVAVLDTFTQQLRLKEEDVEINSL